MPSRSFGSEEYRFGFNGMEADNDLKGAGNSYNFGNRIYDPRLGRWSSLDLYTNKYPSLSGYGFAANSPLIFMDRDGNDFIIITKKNTETSTVFGAQDYYNVNTTYGESFGVLIIKNPGPDRFFFEETTDIISGKFSEDGIRVWEETSRSSTTDKSFEFYPNDFSSASGITRHTTTVLDGLIPWQVDDKDAVTIGKFMNALPEFNDYMLSRNSEAKNWSAYGLASDVNEIVAIGVQIAFFDFVALTISITASTSTNLVKIAKIEDDVIIFEFKVGDETISGMANMSIKEEVLYLNRLHLQSTNAEVTAGNVGRNKLYEAAKDLGKQFNAKEVIIQGGKRTTGKYIGTTPSEIRIKTD
jgi:RHS repeat-associated protein